MANIKEGLPSWDVCEAGPSGLVAPLDPINIEEDEIQRRGPEDDEKDPLHITSVETERKERY